MKITVTSPLPHPLRQIHSHTPRPHARAHGVSYQLSLISQSRSARARHHAARDRTGYRWCTRSLKHTFIGKRARTHTHRYVLTRSHARRRSGVGGARRLEQFGPIRSLGLTSLLVRLETGWDVLLPAGHDAPQGG